MDLTLPAEDLAWKARAKTFAEEVLFPHELELETAGKLTRATKNALRRAVVEHGLNGINHAREVGGQGCTQMQQTLINEELGKATGAVRESVSSAKSKATSAFQDLEGIVDRKVAAAMKSMGLATRAEVDALRKEVERLKKAEAKKRTVRKKKI